MRFSMDNKRRQVSIADKNEIDKLPEDVMNLILERLPIRDIMRTSILSRKWRYKWTRIKAVVFDEQISKKLAKNGAFGRHGFIRVINQVLLLQKGFVSKFSLYIPIMYLDTFQEVDQWILFVSTKGVEELAITNLNRLYQLPSCVFSCLELRKLELTNCIFKPPLHCEGFLCLESLTLNKIDFKTNVGGAMINLPQLKVLMMDLCTNVYNLKINATKLQCLAVQSCVDAMLLELLQSQLLAFVCVLLDKPVKDFVRRVRINPALMFAKMPKVQGLHLDGHFLKDYIAAKPKWLPHALNCLKHLCLYAISLSDMDHLHGVLCLLRNSPNLEELSVMHIQTESVLMHHGVEPTSNHLESPDCLDQTLYRLRTVQLSPLQGSRPQLLFIKLLLAHSPSLEKFTIQSDGTLDASTRFNIAKNVMRFPRASSKAELIYLDPEFI